MIDLWRPIIKRICALLLIALLYPDALAQTDRRALFMIRSYRNESGKLFMSGYVLGEHGTPVSGARIIAILEERPDIRSETKTDEQGKWTLRFLKKGKWVVSAFSAEMMSELTDVFLNANQRDIELILIRTTVGFLIEAKTAIYMENYNKAIHILSWLILYFPESRELGSALFWISYTYNRYSHIQKDRGDAIKLMTKALSYLNRLIEDFPENKWTDDAGILRIDVALRLYQMGQRQSARIIEAGLSVQDRSKIDIKLAALDALLLIDQTQSIRLLSKIVFDDPDPKIRKKAILILGQSGTKEAVALLEQVSKKDPESSVRKAAIVWLERR